MADIASKVAAIRQAVYGKDVRESIASGIEAINTEVVSTTGRQNVINSQEQTRINAEIVRQTNESTRQTNESTRQSEEDARISNENTRQVQEDARIDNELSRQSQETIRQTTFDTHETDRETVFNGLKTEMINATDDANTATINTNTATANYTNIVEQTKKIYKTAVNLYSDISTTYPNPDIGWTVTTKNDGIEYRWDGVEWVDIGVSDTFSGYNVIISLNQPINSNSIWLDAPVSIATYARIFPSSVTPTDTSNIWWETDN